MLTKDERANYGRLACNAGTPDRGQNGSDLIGTTRDAGDTIANILHYLEQAGHDDPVDVLTTARNHYEGENLDEAAEARETGK